MKDIKAIGKLILKIRSGEQAEGFEGDSFFQDPVHGQKNYHSFADFSSEEELATVLSDYLKDYCLSESDFADLSAQAFAMYKQRQDGNDKGDLSEFVYIMH